MTHPIQSTLLLVFMSGHQALLCLNVQEVNKNRINEIFTSTYQITHAPEWSVPPFLERLRWSIHTTSLTSVPNTSPVNYPFIFFKQWVIYKQSPSVRNLQMYAISQHTQSPSVRTLLSYALPQCTQSLNVRNFLVYAISQRTHSPSVRTLLMYAISWRTQSPSVRNLLAYAIS